MIRVALDLENPEDLQSAKAQWKFAPGLVPGEPNEGLTARLAGSPARLADYDDSGWEAADSPLAGSVSPLLCRIRCRARTSEVTGSFLRPA